MRCLAKTFLMLLYRYEHQKMLEFCARHGIKPAVEVLDLNEENINIAFDRLQKNDVRYRFVFKH